jgi:hypothetical protein
LYSGFKILFPLSLNVWGNPQKLTKKVKNMVKKQKSIAQIVENQVEKFEKLLTEKYGDKYLEQFEDFDIFMAPIIRRICQNALRIDFNKIISDYQMKQLFLIADELEDIKKSISE